MIFPDEETEHAFYRSLPVSCIDLLMNGSNIHFQDYRSGFENDERAKNVSRPHLTGPRASSDGGTEWNIFIET